MSTQINDVNEAINAAKKIRLPMWSKLCILVGAFLAYFLFDHFGRTDLGLPILNFIFVVCFIIFVKWKLRRHAWFWITMTIVAALHVPLFLFVPWTRAWVPALVITAIDTADFCLMLWILSVVEKFMEEQKPSENEPRSL